MTDFHLPAEIDSDSGGLTDYEGLIDLVRDLGHGVWTEDGPVDRLSYDLDGDGHFDLVKDDDN